MKLVDVPNGSIAITGGIVLRVLKKKEGRVLTEGAKSALNIFDGGLEAEVVIAPSYVEQVKNLLVPPDKQIVEIREITQDELDGEGWDERNGSPVIVLADGTRIYASQNYEGNGPGALFTRNVDGTHGAWVINKEQNHV
jgi:hypothetical protein